jgi:predicted oxidoreductase (fatty acid repression mutant protein)
MTTSEQLISAVAERRSTYQLSGESTISNARLEELVQKVLQATPSAFNTQTSRIIVLLGDEHRKLWDIVRAALLPHISGEQATTTLAKVASFQAAYGSILFFEDPSPYEPLLGLKTYADKFGSWRDQASAMHQLLLWTALDLEGMGANLQHYNPLIDEQVKDTWNIDSKWSLMAQMVIGKPIADKAAAKPKKPVGDRYSIFQ